MSLAFLRRYCLFNLLPSPQLATWLAASQVADFATGETIFQEGSLGQWAYLVLEGKVRVLKRSPSQRDVSLGSYQPGELLGEYALLPPHQNTATCRAITRARLLRLPLAPLHSWLTASPLLAANLKNLLRLHGLLAHLRERAFLGFISGPSALKFLPHLKPVVSPPVRTIQADGLSADRWYFIQSGQVLLSPSGSDSGEERQLGSGDCFGEKALLGQEGLPVAVALAPTQCLCLTRAHFDSSNPAAQAGTPSLYQTILARLTPDQQRYLWIGQREESDCGIASLAMLVRFHGLDIPLERVRAEVRIGADGATLRELQRAGTQLGLRCRAVQIELRQLAQVELPAIAHLKTRHYVVLYDIEGATAVVGDPDTGIVRLSLMAFLASCSLSLLLVRPPLTRGP
jgi:subfamily B ATP-binding cassette protein HlyB/CyaB